MMRVSRRGEGIVSLFLILFLFIALSLGLPHAVYGGDGIGQPSDGLNSTSPSGSEGTSSALESLALYAALSLLI
jgi:hypothetical protein